MSVVIISPLFASPAADQASRQRPVLVHEFHIVSKTNVGNKLFLIFISMLTRLSYDTMATAVSAEVLGIVQHSTPYNI